MEEKGGDGEGGEIEQRGRERGYGDYRGGDTEGVN